MVSYDWFVPTDTSSHIWCVSWEKIKGGSSVGVIQKLIGALTPVPALTPIWIKLRGGEDGAGTGLDSAVLNS